MDAYMMSSRSLISEDALRLQNRERSKVAAIARWLTGRE
jgi:predicted transcriptional regulator